MGTLWCAACHKDVDFGKKSTVKNHVESVTHITAVRDLSAFKRRSGNIYDFVKAAQIAGVRRAGETLSLDSQMGRMELAGACLMTGFKFPMLEDEAGGFKPILERSIGQFNEIAIRNQIPDLHKMEMAKLRSELNSPSVGGISIITDATTEVHEVAALLVRFFDGEHGVYRQRLDVICSPHTAALAGEHFQTLAALKFGSLLSSMMSMSNNARAEYKHLSGGVGPDHGASVRWGVTHTKISEGCDNFDIVKAVIESPRDFADKLRADMKLFLTPEYETNLRLEMAVYADVGQPIYDFVYRHEGDGFEAVNMHFAKELMLRQVEGAVQGEVGCPRLNALAVQLAGAEAAPALIALNRAKAVNVLNKLRSFFVPGGKMFHLYELYHGLSLLHPFRFRAMGPGPAATALVDKFLLIPSLANVPGLRAGILAELDRYYVMAENVAEDVNLLRWWFGARARLPLLYLYPVHEAVLLQPSSAAAERVFSLLSNMFNKQQRSALEDYKETALMMRYNKLQRLREEKIVM